MGRRRERKERLVTLDHIPGASAGILAAPIIFENASLALNNLVTSGFARMHTVYARSQIMSSWSKERIQSAVARCASALGYAALRPKRSAVVEEFLRGRDVFVSLPTGSGKSLCFAILPKVFDELLNRDCRSIAYRDCRSIAAVLMSPNTS